MWQVFITGGALGLVSSFHCVGMCGPLLMALPVHALPASQHKPAIVLYHAGRLSTYILIGAAFGFAGRHIYMAGLQQWLSITAGAVIISLVLNKWLIKFHLWRPAGPLFSLLQNCMQRLWKDISLGKFFFLGTLNGLLPCGMVYFALAGAVTAGSLISAMYFMFAFGMATLPLLFIANYAGHRFIGLRARNFMRKSTPALLLFIGSLLILRGLNLGIPYISPYLGTTPGSIISCH